MQAVCVNEFGADIDAQGFPQPGWDTKFVKVIGGVHDPNFIVSSQKKLLPIPDK